MMSRVGKYLVAFEIPHDRHHLEVSADLFSLRREVQSACDGAEGPWGLRRRWRWRQLVPNLSRSETRLLLGYLNIHRSVQLCSNILPSSVVGHFSSLLPTLSYYRPQRSRGARHTRGDQTSQRPSEISTPFPMLLPSHARKLS